jgi:hypothetical protein
LLRRENRKPRIMTKSLPSKQVLRSVLREVFFTLSNRVTVRHAYKHPILLLQNYHCHITHITFATNFTQSQILHTLVTVCPRAKLCCSYRRKIHSLLVETLRHYTYWAAIIGSVCLICLRARSMLSAGRLPSTGLIQIRLLFHRSSRDG